MTPHRLESLLSRFAGLSIMVVGDFFLDKYLVLDPSLDEPSLETGLAARQVVARRCMPGAAGTVIANLHALGVGHLHAVGVTGDDGEGYELRQQLAAMGVRLDGLFKSPDRFTPTYIKPMIQQPGGERESNRIDIQNRTPTPRDLEDRLSEFLGDMARGMDGVAVLDQVGRRNTGVVTDRVREAICELGRDRPEKIILADSRERIDEFRHVIRKGNRDEIRRAEGYAAEDLKETAELAAVERWRGGLFDISTGGGEGTARPVYITLGADGLLLIDGEDRRHVPGIRVPGPVDTVGAGDSVTAGIVASLAVGATPMEAGTVGNLAASVTVRQLGVTGTASPTQLVEALKTEDGSVERRRAEGPTSVSEGWRAGRSAPDRGFYRGATFQNWKTTDAATGIHWTFRSLNARMYRTSSDRPTVDVIATCAPPPMRMLNEVSVPNAVSFVPRTVPKNLSIALE